MLAGSRVGSCPLARCRGVGVKGRLLLSGLLLTIPLLLGCHRQLLLVVDKKNQLDVTFCILNFSSSSCSTCFGHLPAATAHTNTRL